MRAAPSLREGVPTAISHGLWLNIPDYDAPTQVEVGRRGGALLQRPLAPPASRDAPRMHGESDLAAHDLRGCSSAGAPRCLTCASAARSSLELCYGKRRRTHLASPWCPFSPIHTSRSNPDC
jgi:hypothetical protein